MTLVEEAGDLKKKLKQTEQRYSKAKAVTEVLKSKFDAEANTANNLKMTISQIFLENKALQHKFEEAM